MPWTIGPSLGLDSDRERWVGSLYRDLPVTDPLLEALTAIRTAVEAQVTASLDG